MTAFTGVKDNIKFMMSDSFNYVFNMTTGVTSFWGKTQEDDPEYCKYGPTIVDMEISTICHGPKNAKGKHQPCAACYKGNSGKGTKMSFETFKIIFDKLPKHLTQIAFGIGDLPTTEDDDMWKMFAYCRENNVVPNLTINGYGLNEVNLSLLARYVGGVAVSLYHSTDDCYNAVEMLHKAGIHQVNIHQILAKETLSTCHKLIDDAATDSRLKKHLRAVVFLTLKPKGPRNNLHYLTDISEYKRLIEKANEIGVTLGMDSCSAKMYLKAMKDSPNFDRLAQMVESCESTRMSFYCNVDGDFYPCSFTEGEPGWETGVSGITAVDFLRDVWFNERIVKFREANKATNDNSVCGDCRSCVTFPGIDPSNWKKVVPINEV